MLVVMVTCYSVKTVWRNYEWTDIRVLSESAVPVNPTNAKVFMTIGNHYAQQVSLSDIFTLVLQIPDNLEHNVLHLKMLPCFIELWVVISQKCIVGLNWVGAAQAFQCCSAHSLLAGTGGWLAGHSLLANS